MGLDGVSPPDKGVGDISGPWLADVNSICADLRKKNALLFPIGKRAASA
jgi:hypothetical protein